MWCRQEFVLTEAHHPVRWTICKRGKQKHMWGLTVFWNLIQIGYLCGGFVLCSQWPLAFLLLSSRPVFYVADDLSAIHCFALMVPCGETACNPHCISYTKIVFAKQRGLHMWLFRRAVSLCDIECLDNVYSRQAQIHTFSNTFLHRWRTGKRRRYEIFYYYVQLKRLISFTFRKRSSKYFCWISWSKSTYPNC